MISVVKSLFLLVAASNYLGDNHVTTAANCPEKVDFEAFSLGHEVNVTVRTFYDPAFGTMQVDFGDDAGIYSHLNATGYCVDFERLIGTANYSADMYSTYDLSSIPADAIDNAQHLDVLNWMINEYPIGKTINPPDASCPEVELSWKEIQVASWRVIDSTKIPKRMFNVNPCHIDYLVSEAFANGEGFEPCCNQNIASLLVIDDDADGGETTGTITNQVVVVVIPLSHLTGPCPAAAKGDPHFTTWGGENYDFHGICDLVLVQNPTYKSGLGMDIQIRTKKTRQWSYISAAAIRIGDEILEVRGEENSYWVNGVAGSDDSNGLSISGHAINIRSTGDRAKEFRIELGDRDIILVKTWHNMVRVEVKNYSSGKFAGSLGLLGSYPEGSRLARNEQTIVEDENDFGQEWQVLTSEHNLFYNLEGPQAPTKCAVPTMVEMRRRLSTSTVTVVEAEHACENIKDKEEFDLCVFDVMATNDEDVAAAY